jgi:hypothetical protein
MFEDEKSVLAFLDHALERYKKFSDAKEPFAAERFMRFPGMKMEDVADSGEAPAIPESHANGKSCPAKPRVRHGTLVARVFGRALGSDGKPVADTTRQEDYLEERFTISVDTQEALIQAVSRAGGEKFKLPDPIARTLIGRAYLGQLDVDPNRGTGPKSCELTAERISSDLGEIRLRVAGRSESVASEDQSTQGPRGDGRKWLHEVRLAWEGLIEVREKRVTRLLLLARGSEKLHWGNTYANQKGENDVAHLPAGRAIDFNGEVRYGILGEPAPEGETADADEAPLGGPQSLHEKMQKLQRGVQAWQATGRDLSPIGRIMQEVEPLMKAGKLREAEETLDRVLRILEEK